MTSERGPAKPRSRSDVSGRAHIGEYLVLDAVAMILASMLNRFAGLQLKQAADIVREHWSDWLTLLIRAECFPPAEQFVCVACAWQRRHRRN